MADGKVPPTGTAPAIITLVPAPASLFSNADLPPTGTFNASSFSKIPKAQRKLILTESTRLSLKRKHSLSPPQPYELIRRARINGNERTIQERRQEIQRILETADAEMPRKKRAESAPVTKKLGGLTTSSTREQGEAMRTETVAMLPCSGYMLPRKNLGSVVFVGGKGIKEGCP